MSRKRKADFVPGHGRPQLSSEEDNSNEMNGNPASSTASIADASRTVGNNMSQSGQPANPVQPGAPQQAQQNQYNVAHTSSILNPLSILLGADTGSAGLTHQPFHGPEGQIPTRYDLSHQQSNASMENALRAVQQNLSHAHQSQASSSSSYNAPQQHPFMQIPHAAGNLDSANLLNTFQLLGLLQSFGVPTNPQPTPSIAASYPRNNNIQSTPQGSVASRQEPGDTADEALTLYTSCDDSIISDYQCLIRKQIELFAAGNEETSTVGQGRNRRVQDGQVGVRCKHCSHIPKMARTKGAVYFPFKIDNVYQASQNMAAVHLCDNCPNIPAATKAELQRLAKEPKSTAGGGKRYWSEAIRIAGIVEDNEGRLRFGKREGL